MWTGLCFQMTGVVWSLLVALLLLPGRGEAQSCIPSFKGPNLAANRTATQSSTYPQQGTITSHAKNAVDGNCNGDWTKGSCSHTNGEKGSWWRVDLGTQTAVYEVVVKKRQDCCTDRIRGAEVHVGDSLDRDGNANPICGTITDNSPDFISTICCRGLKGRYVNIVIPDRPAHLQLCEVEVYGYQPQGKCC